MDSKMRVVRIWLEVGHACEPRVLPLGRAPVLDWRVWVRGVAGADISPFVEKVVFDFKPNAVFPYPRRVLLAPPYEVEQSGTKTVEISIDLHLKFNTKPRQIRLKYNLSITKSSQSSSESRCIYYDFVNPSEQLRQALMRGGGEMIWHTMNGNRLLVLSKKRKDRSRSRPRPFVKPAEPKKQKVEKPISPKKNEDEDDLYDEMMRW